MAKDIKYHNFITTGYMPARIPIEALMAVPNFDSIEDINANKATIRQQGNVFPEIIRAPKSINYSKVKFKTTKVNGNNHLRG